jgi:hypothetical protein
MRTTEKELPGQDSNLDKENQNLLCYRYTTGYFLRVFFARFRTLVLHVVHCGNMPNSGQGAVQKPSR